jgi:hypothetical protein
VEAARLAALVVASLLPNIYESLGTWQTKTI